MKQILGILGIIMFLLALGKALFGTPNKSHEIWNAGGSATGNALELAMPQETLSHPEIIHAWNASIPTAVLSEDSRPELERQRLQAWISAHGIHPQRIIQLSPQGDNRIAKIGEMGPAFQDLSSIPDGLQNGDLLLLREGIYQSPSQFPSVRSEISLQKSLTILAWPNEQPVIEIPGVASQSLRSHWKIYGISWGTAK